MESPYQDLPPRQFWRTGVAEANAPVAPDLYHKKFAIAKDMPVMTAGSCFAQHIGRNMRKSGFRVLNVERAPPGLTPDEAQSFGFNIYSARYGNIYTSTQLRQLVDEAFGRFQPAEPVWEHGGRFYDSQRPSVEPEGLESAHAVIEQRALHLKKVRKLLLEARLFVFTLGLTETWRHRATGTVFPTAPGTIAGAYDSETYEFVNLEYGQILDELEQVRAFLKKRNPDLKFLFTVSPVPLTATASGEHVLAATTYSKSVLRAVAGALARRHDDVDYFPSYEIITSSLSKGRFFESNLRSVTKVGVASVMRTFFAEHQDDAPPATAAPRAKPIAASQPAAIRRKPTPIKKAAQKRAAAKASQEDVICEDALLDAFSPRS